MLFLKSLHLSFHFLFLFFAMQVMQFIYSIILKTCVYFHRQPFVHARPKFHSFKLSFVPVWKNSGTKNLIFECNVCMSNLCTNLCIKMDIRSISLGQPLSDAWASFSQVLVLMSSLLYKHYGKLLLSDFLFVQNCLRLLSQTFLQIACRLCTPTGSE